jgi:sulfide:quinone oxidoreductase
MKHVVILGAGFAGLELATRLSESLADEVQVILIDRSDSFGFGFSKLDLLLGRETMADVRLAYAEIDKPGVEFRREAITSIDPEARRVATDGGSYEADILAIALGADYDFAATPGFEDAGVEYYTFAGAERMRDVVAGFDRGRIVIGILGHPFKCPPAPFEGGLLLHDQLTERGTRDDCEIQILGPMAAPVPVTKEVSQAFLTALADRDIEYVAKETVVSLDAGRREATLASGGSVPYDLFVGVPVHRVPEVVALSGLADEGWVPVDRANLATSFPGVYALGDCTGLPMAKAGVFAESAARVVADDIIASVRGGEPPKPYEGVGSCFLEFGGGQVAKVEANFLGGPSPTAQLVGPSLELADEKREFAAARIRRWFARSSASAAEERSQ